MATEQHNTELKDTSLKGLQSFLRRELNTVETYGQAVSRLSDVGERATLDQCAQSHAMRAEALAKEIERRGARPDRTLGLSVPFAELVGDYNENAEKAIIAALDAEEECTLEAYQDQRNALDPSARELIEACIFPEQERTHQAVSALRHGQP